MAAEVRKDMIRPSRAKFLTAIVALALLGCTTRLVPTDGSTPTQIRLSWSASPKGTMTVVWQTNLPTETSLVEYGNTEKLDRRASGHTVTYAYQTGIIHEASMEELEPGTRYLYRVGDPKGGLSATYSFQTAPDSERDFVFTAFGDHGVGSTSKANVEQVLAEKPDFHLILGDLSYANGNQQVWDQWFEQIEPLSRMVPIMPALGNHDNEKIAGQKIGYAAYLARLALPPPETRYYFDYGAARFISFNSDDFKNEDQMAWFVDALLRARADRSVRWLIVYQHHPLYSSNVGRLDNKPLIQAVREILDRYKVDLVLAGHNHNYERSYPLVGDRVAAIGPGPYGKGKGVVFVISGGGGKSLYRFTPEMPPITAYRESIPHYLRVRVTKKDLRVEALRTQDHSLLDSFSIQEP